MNPPRLLRRSLRLALPALTLLCTGTSSAQVSPRIERIHQAFVTLSGTYASSVLGLGDVEPLDVDAIGADDYLVADPRDQNSAGLVEVFSGASGARLWFRTGTVVGSCGDRFGTAVARIPDINGDGADEVAVGSPTASGPTGCNEGRFEILSGRNGVTLFTETILLPGSRGRATARLPDIDGDGVPEY